MMRRLALALSSLWLILASLPVLAMETVSIGVLADRPKAQVSAQFQPLTRALKQAIPETNFVIEPMSYADLEDAVASRTVDFVLTNPSHFVLIARTSGLSAPLATLIQNEVGKQTSAFGGVIFTKASRNDIDSIYDLKGKSLSATSTKSLGGYQSQAYEINQRGLAIENDMRLIEPSSFYDNVVQAVLSGKADVGFVRSGLLENMAEEGKVDLKDFKIINQQKLPDFPYRVSTRLFPEWPIAALPHTDAGLTRKVASVLLKLEEPANRYPHMSVYGFNVPADYSPVVEILQELRLPPFENTPEFTAEDIWKRYRGWASALILAALLVAGLAAGLVATNRRLLFARIDAESNAILLKHEHQQLETLLKAIPDVLFEVDEHGRIISVWSRDEALLSTQREKLLGHTLKQALPTEAGLITMQAITEAAEHGSSFGKQIRLKLAQNDHWFELSVALKSEEGAAKTFIMLSRDVTERKQTEEKLRLASMVYQNTNEAMIITDAENHIIAVNPAFSKMTGYEEAEVLGMDPALLRSDRQDDEFFQDMWASINSTGQWQGEIWNRRKSGEEYAELLTINSVYDEQGKLQSRVALFSDLTYIKESEALIWQQANYDTLTELPNRRLFIDRLDLELKKAHRDGHMVALLFLDLDHFKEVNDTMGHHIGDSLLKEAAQRIQACVRESDTVARIGGDEFTLILSELSEFADIERIADDIIDTLSQPFQFEGRKFFISASIGITVYPDDAKNVENLLKNADQAMYAAKQAGRNRYRYFTKSMQEAAQERVQLAHDLRDAVANNQLMLYYQPIINLNTGRIHKAEALLRWQHPERGLIKPTRFIQIAEDIGIIDEIGDWVFEQAVKQAESWRNLYDRAFQISINASPVQFQDKNKLDDRWIEYLRDKKLGQDSIVVEITEGLLLHSQITVQDTLLNFRDAGIQVAIDDFGTGYSSLAYLNKFDIDYLKIDQSFIRNLAPNTNDLTLTEAIVVMAHKLGLHVIAEGVETEEQFRLLKQIGCDFGQGFLFAKPLPADQLEERLLASLESRPATT